jgi:hypothetical protein
VKYLIGAVVGVALTVAGGALAGSTYFWGNERAFISVDGEMAASLRLQADKDLNVGAGHIRFEAADGNFEFESGERAEASRISPYDIGTPKRKPLLVGGSGDHQDVLALIVEGTPRQQKPLQEWRAGDRAVASIDAHGQLTTRRVKARTISLGDARLFIRSYGNRLYLIAVLPDGRRFQLPFQQLTSANLAAYERRSHRE